jgi:YidC/Oxa1 family membrane protein insertase
LGFLTEIIGYPLGFIMWLLYQIGHSYALALILFTIVTRALMFPLSVKQQKQQAMMTAFQPKLEELKRKYPNNQQKQQDEQMKLYAEEGINPMASCLPLLIQFPLLFGIFDVVYRPLTHIIRASKPVIDAATQIAASTFETVPTAFTSRPEIYIVQAVKQNEALFTTNLAQDFPAIFANNAELIPQMQDFAEKTAAFNNTFFGMDFGAMPDFTPVVWDRAAIMLAAIPILSGLVQMCSSVYMYLRQKKMQKASGAQTNPVMNSMMLMMFGMPIISVWIAIGYPAGIGFYWTISGIVGFGQMLILNKLFTPEYVAKLVEKDKEKRRKKGSGKRQSMLERYQKMLEEQQGTSNTNADTKRNTITVSSAKFDDEDDLPADGKITKSKQRDIERKLINEARRKQAEKYGDTYSED